MDSQLKRMLKDFPAEARRKVKGAIIETALTEVETPAKQNCRVDTGRLRSSIHTKYSNVNANYKSRDEQGNQYDDTIPDKPKDTNNEYTVIVGTNVEYAKKIESKDHMLENAFVNSQSKLKNAIIEAIRGIT